MITAAYDNSCSYPNMIASESQEALQESMKLFLSCIHSVHQRVTYAVTWYAASLWLILMLLSEATEVTVCRHSFVHSLPNNVYHIRPGRWQHEVKPMASHGYHSTHFVRGFIGESTVQFHASLNSFMLERGFITRSRCGLCSSGENSSPEWHQI
jgi:hypothetical protein